MSLYEHFFKALSLYLEARIRIRVKVMRIRNIGYWTIVFWARAMEERSERVAVRGIVGPLVFGGEVRVML
jgi:hypothetical protein